MFTRSAKRVATSFFQWTSRTNTCSRRCTRWLARADGGLYELSGLDRARSRHGLPPWARAAGLGACRRPPDRPVDARLEQRHLARALLLVLLLGALDVPGAYARPAPC